MGRRIIAPGNPFFLNEEQGSGAREQVNGKNDSGSNRPVEVGKPYQLKLATHNTEQEDEARAL
jgi:hypothetical protein